MTDSLRTDVRSWEIYQDEQVGAVIRAAELYALSVTGQKLSRHPDEAIRGIGNAMLRIGEHRGQEALAEDGARSIAVQWFSLMGAHLAGIPHDEIKCAQARKELHGVFYYFDRRAKVMGTNGSGVKRSLLRGD